MISKRTEVQKGQRAPNAGGPSLIPGQRTRFHTPEVRVCVPQLKISHAAGKIEDPMCFN